MDRNGVSITLPKVQPPTVDELRSRVSSLCARYSVQKLEVFGSVAEGTAKAGSDVDLMVTFQLNTEFGIEFFDMKLELEELLGFQQKQDTKCKYTLSILVRGVLKPPYNLRLPTNSIR